MSASREKNKRKEQAAVPETANEAKKGMSKGLKTTLIAVCTILVVCIVVFFYMLTSGFFASHTTAATVSGHNLSPAMVNYFYKKRLQHHAGAVRRFYELYPGHQLSARRADL